MLFDSNGRVKEMTPTAYRWWVASGYVIVLLLGIFSWFYPLEGINLAEVLLGFVPLYSAASVQIVREDETGALIFLGRPIRQVHSGPVFAPLGFAKVRRETQLVRQREFPGDPEFIHYEDTPVPSGKVRPWHVTTGAAPAGSTPTDPLDDRMTLRVAVFVSLQMKSNGIIDFITNIGSYEEAFRRIQDTITPVVQQQFAIRTPARILEEFDQINRDHLRPAVETLIGTWGVNIVELSLKPPDIGRTVSEALRSVPTARLEKQASIAASEAKAQEIFLTGQRVADVRELFLKGEANGFKEIATALGLGNDPRVAMEILQTQAARDALSKAGNVTVIGSGGVASLLGLIQAAVQQAATATSTTTTPTTVPAGPNPATPGGTAPPVNPPSTP